MSELTFKDVRKQSEQVWEQFGESKWIPYSKKNANHPNRRNPNELHGIGRGKVLVSVALGASLEGQIDTLKKYRDRYDIIVCDKGFGPLLERGIKADFVMGCDCNILAWKWFKDYAKETDGVKLIATPYFNPDWTDRWKGPIYFYVNRDAIDSQNVFKEIVGDVRTIPASSNVSNAQVVFMTGADEWQQKNFAGYERIVLVGYDYSWKPEGNYYAWTDPKPKRYYQHHATTLDVNREMVFTSSNLTFSARWLSQYIKAYKLNIVNCSGGGLLQCPQADLEQVLSNIHPDRRYAVENSFTALHWAEKNYQAAQVAFEASRRAIWQ